MESSAAPRTKEAFLDARVRELVAYWLDLRCEPSVCTKIAVLPLRSIAAHRGGQLHLRQVIARLRCSSCGARPVVVTITDSPISKPPHEAMDGAKWRVALWP